MTSGGSGGAADDANGGRPSVAAFVNTLVRQLDSRSEAQLQREREVRAQCMWVKIGTKTVQKADSPDKGKQYSEQQRCSICQVMYF